MFSLSFAAARLDNAAGNEGMIRTTKHACVRAIKSVFALGLASQTTCRDSPQPEATYLFLAKMPSRYARFHANESNQSNFLAEACLQEGALSELCKLSRLQG
jgi:hypothetical protein